MKSPKRTWSQIKAVLATRKDLSVVDLLRDLYGLSEANRDFIYARLAPEGSTLQPYLETVENALYPDVARNKPVRLGEARRAIAAYRQASHDSEGVLELMLRFVECGTDFTADYGDMGERFYSSLSGMFEEVVEVVMALPSAEQRPYVERLKEVVHRASGVGWGYGSDVAAAFREAFPDDVEAIDEKPH